MSNNNNIKSFIKEIPVQLDEKKQISLYTLLKKKCPETIRTFNERNEGKKSLFISQENKDKWYAQITNYLVKNDILELTQDDNESIHTVTDEWKKYFSTTSSRRYNKEVLKEHLMLYSQTAVEFLEKAGILDPNGNELFDNTKDKKGNKFISKYQKYIKIALDAILAITILNYILLISKYGIIEMTPILSNTCLFSLSCIFLTSLEKK